MLPRAFLVIGIILLLWDRTALSAEPADWETLQARKKALSAMKPLKAEGNEFEQFVNDFSLRAGELADAFKSFHDTHPDSKEGRDAWRQWMNYLNIAAMRIPERKAELEAAEKLMLADSNLSKTFRESIRWNQVERIQDLAEREKFVRSVKHEFSGGSSFASHFLLEIANFSDPDHARALVDEVLKMPRSKHELEYWNGKAMEIRAKLDRIGKPLELKFTALDGAKIDLKDYAGKVVLIDFWATWCGPCIAGIPKVRAIWKEHQRAGFEIICISYDQDRKTLDNFITKNSIPWPQFFSEQGKEAALAAQLGSPGPPAYWLIDRNGHLADISGWSDLEGKVKNLLAQKDNQPKPVK